MGLPHMTVGSSHYFTTTLTLSGKLDVGMRHGPLRLTGPLNTSAGTPEGLPGARAQRRRKNLIGDSSTTRVRREA